MVDGAGCSLVCNYLYLVMHGLRGLGIAVSGGSGHGVGDENVSGRYSVHGTVCINGSDAIIGRRIGAGRGSGVSFSNGIRAFGFDGGSNFDHERGFSLPFYRELAEFIGGNSHFVVNGIRSGVVPVWAP